MIGGAMSPSMIGLVAGLVIGAVNGAVILRVAAQQARPQTTTLLKAVAIIDLILFPAVGWAIGTYVFGGPV